MSKARAQSARRRMMRSFFLNGEKSKASKRPGMRMQVIHIHPPKKRGRKNKSQIARAKWLERLHFHIGESKVIYHIKD